MVKTWARDGGRTSLTTSDESLTHKVLVKGMWEQIEILLILLKFLLVSC